MKISELQIRENYNQTLPLTIERMIQIDRDFYRDDIDCNHTIQWYFHPVFSVYVTRGFCDAGRRFLKKQYGYAPNGIRKMIQPLAIQLLSVSFGFERMLQPAFKTTMVPHPEYMMIMPGNCRFRKFDFANRTVRVYPKAGFSDIPIHREISIRAELDSAKKPLDITLPLNKAQDPAKGYKTFEEPLIDATPINRIPGLAQDKRYIQQIETILTRLHQFKIYEETIDGTPKGLITSGDYIHHARNLYDCYSKELLERFPGILLDNVYQRIMRAFDIVSRESMVDTCWTHGDFQPGNILVYGDDPKDIILADWEDVGGRASVYDGMTYNLESRTKPGVYKRLDEYIKHPERFPLHVDCAPDVAAALWEIEEWLWLMESSSREGIVRMPLGLCRRFKETADVCK